MSALYASPHKIDSSNICVREHQSWYDSTEAAWDVPVLIDATRIGMHTSTDQMQAMFGHIALPVLVCYVSIVSIVALYMSRNQI